MKANSARLPNWQNDAFSSPRTWKTHYWTTQSALRKSYGSKAWNWQTDIIPISLHQSCKTIRTQTGLLSLISLPVNLSLPVS
jgi:hypothetical protein